MKIRYKIWLESDGKTIFGKGREELLRAIDEFHSLYAAAKKLNMSYRAAWGRIKASEERLGIKLTCADGQGKALHLTLDAKALLEKFDKLERDVDSFKNSYNRAFSLEEARAKAADKTRERVNSERWRLTALTAPLFLFFADHCDLINSIEEYLEVL